MTSQIESLEARIAQLEAENQALRVNPWFGTLTRNAGDLQIAQITDWSGRAIVYFDIDGLKVANNRWGKEESSRRIAAALRHRAEDVITYFSGDEFVLIVDVADAVGAARRLQAELHAVGMSATFAVLAGATGPDDILAAEEMVSACKDVHGRDAIYIGGRRRSDMAIEVSL